MTLKPVVRDCRGGYSSYQFSVFGCQLWKAGRFCEAFSWGIVGAVIGRPPVKQKPIDRIVGERIALPSVNPKPIGRRIVGDGVLDVPSILSTRSAASVMKNRHQSRYRFQPCLIGAYFTFAARQK